jgi:hypothetical protein
MALPSPRFSPPPRGLRKATLDNLVLVAASQLPFKAEYQAIANQQPPGTTLVVLPSFGSRQRLTLEHVASGIRAKGRSVVTVSERQVHP